jgi:hypothetical protein
MATARAKHEAEFNIGLRCAQLDDMGHTVLTRTRDDVADQKARCRSGIAHEIQSTHQLPLASAKITVVATTVGVARNAAEQNWAVC